MFRDHANLVLICGAMVSACRGDQGSSCTIQHGRDGTDTVSCSDGTSLKVNEPPAGNGGSSPSCTIQDNDNGSKTISCVDGTSVTVREAQGGAGSTAVGLSCTIEDNGDGTKTVSCADGTSVTVRDARGDAGSSAQSCSSAAGESGSLCAAAFPRRVVHACREEDTFVGLATAENVLQSATDTLGIDLVLRATDSAFVSQCPAWQTSQIVSPCLSRLRVMRRPLRSVRQANASPQIFRRGKSPHHGSSGNCSISRGRARCKSNCRRASWRLVRNGSGRQQLFCSTMRCRGDLRLWSCIGMDLLV